MKKNELDCMQMKLAWGYFSPNDTLIFRVLPGLLLFKVERKALRYYYKETTLLVSSIFFSSNIMISSLAELGRRSRFLCFFFLEKWPKTYQGFYEKQRYNLVWPNLLMIRLQCYIFLAAETHSHVTNYIEQSLTTLE